MVNPEKVEARRHLMTAVRAFKPEERRHEFESVMSEIAEEERRRDLLKKVEALSTEEIERLVAGHGNG